MTSYSRVYFKDNASSKLVSAIDSDDTLITVPQEDFLTFYNLPTEDQYDDLYLYAVLRSSYARESIIVDRANSLPDTNQLKIIRNVDGYGAHSWGKGTLIFRDLVKTLLELFVPKGYRSYAGNPDGVVSSLYKGEKLLNTNGLRSGSWHIANGDGTTSWNLYAGSSAGWVDRTEAFVPTGADYFGHWDTDHWVSDEEEPF